MNIHYFSGEDWEEKYVREKLSGHTITFHEGPFSAFTGSDDAAEALCIFVESKVTEADLARFPNVELIATRSTGYDHIDIAAAHARDITVVNVPFYGENTVAEFAFALILSLSRRIPEAQAKVRSGVFSPSGLRGFDLNGKTMGVLGTGHIGAHLIRMAQGFGMKVIAFDAFPNEDIAHTLGFTYMPLTEVLGSSDVISIHVPYNEHTHHLINKSNIGSIKKGAYLINTSRGAVIETEALVEALKNESLAGAGLDVLEEEGDMADEMKLMNDSHPKEAEMKTLLENHYLVNHPRVIVTPHVAFNTLEAVMRIIDATIKNIDQYSAGTPENVVK